MAVTVYRADELTEDQWGELRRLLLAIHKYHEPLNGLSLLPNWFEKQRVYLASLPDAVILIAREAGTATGFVNGWVSRNATIFDETYAHISNAYVEPDERGRGVGRLLTEAFESWARAQGVHEVRLNVDASNELGKEFWDAAGFRTMSATMRKRL